MSQDDVMRQGGKVMYRQSWSVLPALSNILKSDFCATKRNMNAMNNLIREWTIENPFGTAVERLNWFRVVILTLQIRMAANRNV